MEDRVVGVSSLLCPFLFLPHWGHPQRAVPPPAPTPPGSALLAWCSLGPDPLPPDTHPAPASSGLCAGCSPGWVLGRLESTAQGQLQPQGASEGSWHQPCTLHSGLDVSRAQISADISSPPPPGL